MAWSERPQLAEWFAEALENVHAQAQLPEPPVTQNREWLGSPPPYGSQNLPAPAPIPAVALDPVQVRVLGDITLFLEAQKAKRIVSSPSQGGRRDPAKALTGKVPDGRRDELP